ncbi:GDSL-type esterase/lipase family protein [Metamycoplasma hyosynoviae]|uniref:SGNH/GDSL hydrolase family protein n=1 Tax=Metamycoplasma hyosynoviae TaxID=29559 RepID=UPI0023627EF4|nr:SGNH/GDSL hydrolase family protein [Metamycoplasma hyosynoviae]MDD1378777.1 GDSL-type esterase/lipase family protein [Metamycoplasma hyosynoviae]
MSNSKINKKLLMILSSLGFTSATTTLLTMSCSCREDDLNKIAQNVKIHEIPNKSEIKASELTKEQVKFYNYDALKYTCEVIKLEANNSKGTVDVYYQLKNKKTNNVSILLKSTLNSFKLSQSLDPEGDNPNPQTPSDPKQLDVQKSKNIIKKDERVRYLALGDSITAGFTGVLDKDYQGKRNPDGSLSGMSYPVYLAHFLNKDKANRVEKFNNFATSNSTILEWLDLLDVEYISANPDIFKNEESVYQHTFDGRYTDKTEFKKQLVKEIKDSNLITLTLGANDFFRFFNSLLRASNLQQVLEKMIEASQQGKPIDFLSLLSFYTEFISKAKAEISARLKVLIQKISELNPNTNIAIFNYPAPFLRFLVSLYDFLPDGVKSMIKGKDLINYLISPLTSAIYDGVRTSKVSNVSFVNIFDNEFWAENQEKLTSVFLDLHPTIAGYKKLATDAFLKLTNSSISKAILKRFGWTDSYFDDYANSHQQFIELNSDDYTDFYKSVFGKNKEESLKKLYDEDEIYDSVKSHISLTNISRRFRSFTDDQITEIIISILVKSQRWDYLQKLDPDANIPSFFQQNGEAATRELVKWLKKSKYINQQLDNFQKLLIETDWDKDGVAGVKVLKKEHIIKLFNETFLKKENLLELLKEFLASDFTKNFKDSFAKAIEGFIKNALSGNKLNALIEFIATKFEDKYNKFIDRKDFVLLLKEILHSDNLPKLFGTSIKSLLTAGNEALNPQEAFDKVTSFSELIKAIFSNQAQNSEIEKSFTKLFQEIISKPDINPIIVRAATKFITTNPEFAPLLEGINETGVKHIIGAFANLFIKFENKFSVSSVLAQAMIGEIAQNGFEFKFDKFKEIFISGISKTFGSFEKGLEILKLMSNEEDLKTYQTILQQLFKNLIKFGLNKSGAKEKLENAPFLTSILSKTEIQSIYDKLTSDNNITRISEYLKNVILARDLNLDGIATPKELIERVLNSNDLSPINLVKDLIRKNLIQDHNISNVFGKLIKTKFANVPFMEHISGEQISVLIRNFFTLCVNLDDKQQFLKKTILIVVENILDLNQPAETLYKRLFDTIKQEFFGSVDKVKVVIKDLLSEDIMTGGKSWIINYLKKLNNPELNALLANGSIKQMLDKLYADDSITTLSAETIYYLVNPLTFEDLSTFDKTIIIKKLIGKDSEFYKNVPDKVVDLIKKLIKDVENKKIFTTFVKGYLETKFPKLKNQILVENFEKLLNKFIEIIISLEDKHSVLKNGMRWLLRYFEENISSFDFTKFAKDFSVKVITKILSMIKGHEKEFVDKIFDTLKEALQITDETKPNFLTKFIWEIIPTSLKTQLQKYLNEDKLTHFINQFIVSGKIKELFTKSLSAIVKNIESKISTIKSFDDFVKAAFSNADSFNEVISFISNNIEAILRKPSLQAVLASVVKGIIPSPFNVEESDLKVIISNLLPEIAKKANEQFKVVEEILKAGIKAIGDNGLNIEKVKESIFKTTQEKFKELNKFETIIKFINDNINSFKKQEVVNAIKNILKSSAAPLVDKLPESILKFVSKSELVEVVKSIFDNQKIYDTIFDIISKINTDITHYQGLSITNLWEILVKFVKKEKDYIKSKIEEIGKDFVTKTENQEILVRLIKANFKEYTSIELKSDNDAFFKKLIQNMFEILKGIKIDDKSIYDYVFDIVLDNVEEPSKITQELSKPDFIGKLYSVPFLVNVLNQQQIKESKEDVTKLIKEIFQAFSSDDTKIETFLNKFKVVQMINDDPATQETTKNLIKFIIKNSKTSELLENVIRILFDSAENLKTAKRWIDVVKTIASAGNVSDLKTKFKDFIKELFNDNQSLLAKQIDVILTKMWSNDQEHYRKNVIENNKHTIEKFVDTFFKAVIIENTLFNTILDNVFDKLKEVNVKAKDQIKEIKNKAILGAIKFITKDKENAIHLPTLVSKYKDNIVKLFENIDSKAFTNMINYIFEASIFSLDSGIYSFLFGGKFKTKAQENFNEIKNNVKSRWLLPKAIRSIRRYGRQNRNGETYEEVQDLKIDFQVGDGAELISLISADKLIGSIFMPSIKEFIHSVSDKKYSKDDLNKIIKKLPGYRATSRIYAAITMMLFSNMDLNQFWPDSGLQLVLGAYPENFISKGIEFAYTKALSRNDLKKKFIGFYKTGNDGLVVGMKYTSGGWFSTEGIGYDKHFFAGYADGQDSRSKEFKNFTKHSEDSIISFIINYEKEDTTYHNKKNIVLIAKLLQWGYLYKDMDNNGK